MPHRRPLLAAPPLPEPAPDPGSRRGLLAAAGALIASAALLGRARPARAATQDTSPFVGELMLFAGNFAPLNWAICDGSLLPISSYTALFSLLGTYYGGNGVTTFALPDLRARVPVHVGTSSFGSPYVVGQFAGSENVALLTSQLPAHAHVAAGDTAVGTSNAPGSLGPARDGAGTTQYGGGAGTALASGHIAPAGSGLPHNNMPPYLALVWCISLFGTFPTRS